MSMENKRITWIDITKGIGIFLVVWAHAIDRDSIIWRSINSFHMPLFYFLSGYVFNDSDITFNDMVYRIQKKVNDLWTPFVRYSIFVLLLFTLITRQETMESLIRKSIAILMMRDTAPLLGATWFITTLFFAQVLLIVFQYFRCRVGILKNLRVDFISIAVSFAAGFLIPNNKIGRIFVAVAFLILGKVYRQFSQMHKEKLSLCHGQGRFVCCVLCCAVVVSSVFNKVSVAGNSYQSHSLFILQAICGIMMVVILSKIIDSSNLRFKNILLYWGKNSVGIVYWQFLSFKIILFMQEVAKYDGVSIWDYPVNYCYNSPIWVIGYIVAGVYGSIFLHKTLMLASFFGANFAKKLHKVVS